MGRHCRTGRQGRLVSVSLRDICGVLCMLALCKSKGTRNLRAHLSMRHAAGLIHAHALRARIGSISLEHVLRAFACFLTWCGGCSLKARGFHLTPRTHRRPLPESVIIYMYIYTHTHTYIYKCIYTHTHTYVSALPAQRARTHTHPPTTPPPSPQATNCWHATHGCSTIATLTYPTPPGSCKPVSSS